jgi:formate hydrogenlyase subunit 3/multisubunit Na+/H+ antiporter MnhD subunit
VYAAAVFGFILYLSSAYKLSGFKRAYSVEEVETFEESTWAAQQISLSRGLSESYISEDVYTSIVKLSLGICILVLMGAAPFAGFFLKYLIVSLFSSSSAFLVCAIILVSTAVTNLAYFDLLTHVSEKISGYSGRSYNE